MRRKRNLEARTAACSAVLAGRLENYRSRADNITGVIDFTRIFGNSNPVRLEIGCGKGRFIRETAALNPGVNFIALEKSENVLITALENSVKEKPPNLRFILGRAEYIGEILESNAIERIYLNFSCPFPKNTDAKLRLTHSRFLGIYRKILVDDGVVELKTDDLPFFNFSVKSLTENGFAPFLNGEPYKNGVTGKILTEYEEKFLGFSKPIYYLTAKKTTRSPV
jgi:tRNA (guanine-N7-)-methyltransferase